jgi:RNA polymerase sigma-70 factor (ECF subfamily)
MDDERKKLIKRLFGTQGGALRSFFRGRVRAQQDVADLVQEVYLRMLRVRELDLIRCPEAYLFAIANNLTREQGLAERRAAASVELESGETPEQLQEFPDFEDGLDATQRSARLAEVLGQLSPKCEATIRMQFYHGMSYQEIGAALGISIHMVKKYHSQGLAECRRRMVSLR